LSTKKLPFVAGLFRDVLTKQAALVRRSAPLRRPWANEGHRAIAAHKAGRRSPYERKIQVSSVIDNTLPAMTVVRNQKSLPIR